MATPRPSVVKRQREAAKRERQQLKAEKRAARKEANANAETEDVVQDESTPNE